MDTTTTPLAVTVDSAGAMLGVSRRTIYRLAKQGKIRIVKITSDSPRVLRADLETFLASCDLVEADALAVSEEAADGPWVPLETPSV